MKSINCSLYLIGGGANSIPKASIYEDSLNVREFDLDN